MFAREGECYTVLCPQSIDLCGHALYGGTLLGYGGIQNLCTMQKRDRGLSVISAVTYLYICRIYPSTILTADLMVRFWYE